MHAHAHAQSIQTHQVSAQLLEVLSTLVHVIFRAPQSHYVLLLLGLRERDLDSIEPISNLFDLLSFGPNDQLVVLLVYEDIFRPLIFLLSIGKG